MLLVCTYKGAGGALQGGQGRVKSSNGTFSTYDYTRMTLLIVTSPNWVWPCVAQSVGHLPSKHHSQSVQKMIKTRPYNENITTKRGQYWSSHYVPSDIFGAKFVIDTF